MSNFADSHSLPTFKERRKAKLAQGKANYLKWLYADEIVSDVYVDLVNGLTRSDVTEKLLKGLYETQKKPVKERTAQDYVAAAYQRMKYDFESKAEELRADLYTKLMAVYADAVKKSDRFNAIVALDKIMKLTGCAMDKPQTAIQINNNTDGISINFGFNKEETDGD